MSTPAPAPSNTNTSSDFEELTAGVTTWVSDFIASRQGVVVPVLAVIGMALILNIIQRWLLKRYARRMDNEGFQWTSVIAAGISTPLAFTIWVIGLTMVCRMLLVPDPDEAESALLNKWLGLIRMGLILLLLGWAMARTVRRFEVKFAFKARQSNKLDLTAVHAISNFLVIFIWLMTLMIAAQSYGVNMSAVLTLGGASAFALSFAFQDVFKNIFGGVVILLTRPFRVGDGITLVGKCISGSVERIGIYQTRIRGWDKIPCIIPNSVFLTDSVQNITGVTQRRIEFVIGLRYQDFSKIEPILAEIEAAVKAHDSVDQEGLLRVVFSDYADSSLNITIICMSVPDTDAGGGATIKQDLMLKVGRIVADHGADFAFPTQTLDFPVPVQVTSSSSS